MKKCLVTLSVLVLVIAVTYIVIRGIGIWRFRA